MRSDVVGCSWTVLDVVVDDGVDGRGRGRGRRLAHRDVDRAAARHLRVRGRGLAVDVARAGPRRRTSVSKVVLATRPAPVMADWAAALRLADDAGHRDAVPLETTRLTEVLGGTLVPGAGFWADTTPAGYWLEQALVWLPTFRPAWVRVRAGAAGDCPSTLGTETDVCVPDTVRFTWTVWLDLGARRRGSGSAPCPPAGCSSRSGRCS